MRIFVKSLMQLNKKQHSFSALHIYLKSKIKLIETLSGFRLSFFLWDDFGVFVTTHFASVNAFDNLIGKTLQRVTTKLFRFLQTVTRYHRPSLSTSLVKLRSSNVAATAVLLMGVKGVKCTPVLIYAFHKVLFVMGKVTVKMPAMRKTAVSKYACRNPFRSILSTWVPEAHVWR